MEESQMGEMSALTESGSEQASANANQEEDKRRTLMAICCFLLILLILLLLSLSGVFSSASEEENDAGKTDAAVYATIGGPGPKPPSASSATTTASTASTTHSTTTTSTTTTTTEDSWAYSQDYTKQIWTYLHLYLCPFWADKQGFRSHRRTYGIAFFPYMFCHYAMYCCYSLDDNMQLQPELPHVDLPPRDAVRRMANYKSENPYLKVWLVVRGPDTAFYKLMTNANNEMATFQSNAMDWMKDNNYDGIRIWWINAPDTFNRSLAQLYNETNDVFMTRNYTFGLVFPYGAYVRAPYNTSKLAHRRALHTIVMYHDYPRKITNRTTATTYTIRELRVYSQKLNETDRPSFCHLYPFVALTYKINATQCENGTLNKKYKPYNIKPLGYGPAGPLTKMEGILSLPEACDIIDPSWNVTTIMADQTNFFPNYHFACKGEDAIAFTDGEDVYYNLAALDQEFEEEVFGVMNPEYDDFPGVCPPPVGDNQTFPTMRNAFQIMIH
ncbi:hypothetical protein HPB50_010306 [Hyalomma asiaticum]|uniref:Uncharacterized protein n=1 Tax=Hyalomma asiaticum TaxID=266040 RepID=A0ACB7SMB1_HYAAI|nr:hypothetical protein HPB50_010306 [Hyalomma asiaticum]